MFNKKLIGILVATFLATIATTATFVSLTDIRYGFTSGISMKPTWQEHNIIWGYVPKNITDIHVGDVIVFDFNGESIVHQVTDIYLNYSLIFAWGDNKEACISGQAITFDKVKFIVTGHVGLW